MSDKPFASLCLLSYQRLDFLKRTVESLTTTPAGFDFELIIHDDGSDQEVREYLYQLQRDDKLSWLIINNGKNMGIGKSIQNCLRIASGEYLFKLDADLEFKPNWLAEAIKMLKHENVGCVSLFDYRNYDPNDNRFNILMERENYYIVEDFVSSIYGFRRSVWEKYGSELGTDGWHQYVKKQGFDLAISKHDFVHNFGFGIESSIYLDKDSNGEIITRKTEENPKLF